MFDPWICDLAFLEHAREQYYDSRKREQTPRTCNVCKAVFPSGQKLFKHLSENRLHMAELHEVSHIYRCKSCDYEEWITTNSTTHMRRIDNTNNNTSEYVSCGPIYKALVKISPYSREENSYMLKMSQFGERVNE